MPSGIAPALLALFASVVLPAAAPASPRTDWILNCQGCHLADGRGHPGSVPDLVGKVGRFVRLPEGRAFLIQVPGVAQSELDDAALAALLNWMLETYSKAELPADFAPYTAEEVARHRSPPLLDVGGRRAEIVERLKTTAPAP
jgi:hypothetical protein